jgi:hypothetical protein
MLAGEFTGDAAAGIDVLAPIDGAHRGVEGIGSRRLELGHLQQDAARRARPQAGAIPHCQFALERNTRGALAHRDGTDLPQFLPCDIRQSPRHRGNEAA